MKSITPEMSAAFYEAKGRMNGEDHDEPEGDAFDSWCVNCGTEAWHGLCDLCRDEECDRDRLDDR